MPLPHGPRTPALRVPTRLSTGILQGLAIGAALLLAGVRGAGAAEAPPHIVVILADDLGYGDLGCYNKDAKIATPNLDRLARSGMRFTDAHTPASVCTPTRYGLLTGRYPWRSALKKGVLQGYSPALLEPGRLTLASLLRQKGYYTACIGKWHLGLGLAKQTDYAQPLRPGPNTAGFDYFFGIAASLDMPPYVYIENEGVTEAPSAKTPGQDRAHGGALFWRAGAIAPGFKHSEVLGRLTDRAIDVIHKQAAQKPLFLYLPLTAPHMPVLPTAKYAAQSDAGPYGDFVMQVDGAVGQVLKALDDAKIADNTLVIFTSDNGAYWFPEDIQRWNHRANGLLRGQKADIWEAGHRVPFLARWPGKVSAGSTSSEVICLTDLMATAASLVAAKLPADAAEDSFDLLPVLLGKKLNGPLRPATIHQAADGTLAVRQGPWRLARVLGSHGFSSPKNIVPRPGEATGELVNLDRDLRETTNLWLREPEVVRRLTALLEQAQAAGGTRPR
jgi:arylsulfatase A